MGVAVAVALSVTAAMPTLATSVCGPGMSPSVQVPGEATPSAPVDTVGEVTLPPLEGVKVTTMPGRGLPAESTSLTEGATGTAERIWADCASPCTTDKALKA